MMKRFLASPSVLYLVGCGALAAAVVAASGEQKKVGIQLEDTDVPCAMFTPDGKYIVAGGGRKISLIDVKSHKLIDRFPEDARDTGGGARTCAVIALSPDGKQVASVSDGTMMPIRIWNFQTGRLLRSIDTDRTEVRALAFSPDGKQLAAGVAYRMHDGPRPYESLCEIWLWDLTKNDDKPVRFRGPEAPVQGIVFLPDGKRMVSASNDWTMRIWDLATQREIKRSGMPRVLAPFPPGSMSGQRLSSDQWQWLHDIDLLKFPMKISADGKHLICGHSVWSSETLTMEYFTDGRRLWRDFDKWQRLHHWQVDNPKTKESEIFGTLGSNGFGTLTTDGRRFVCQDGGTLFVFDVKTGDLILEDRVFKNDAWVYTLDVSPDGRHAFAAGDGIGGPGMLPTRDPNQLYLYRLPPLSTKP